MILSPHMLGLIYFNSRPRVGGVSWRISASPGRTYFNSRPRVGGVLDDFDIRAGHEQFQFSPPRGGRPVGLHEGQKVHNISILAPAWGASETCETAVKSNRFQFSPPRGGRHAVTPSRRSVSIISILAPAWGASDRFLEDMGPALFQFSPPRGGRLGLRRAFPLHQYFNSRPRVGGVHVGHCAREYRNISILAPAWGASIKPPPGTERRALISILAPAWGASGRNAHIRRRPQISILAPAWGASGHTLARIARSR